jgi:sulfur carrier protein ThiS
MRALVLHGKMGYTEPTCFSREAAMIEVEVRLYATLQRYHPRLALSEPLTIQLGDSATLEDLLDELNIPSEEVKVAFVNGRRENRGCQLQDECRVGIFPPVGGG